MRALAFAIAGALLCVPAYAQGPYVEGTFNASLFRDVDNGEWTTDFATSYGASLAGGYDFGEWTIEGEVLHTRALVNEGAPLLETREQVQGAITGIVANIAWEPETPIIVDPYFFAGLGMGYVGFDPFGHDGFRTEVFRNSANLGDIGLLWQVGTGLKMPLTDDGSWQVFAEARYVRVELASPFGTDHMSPFTAIMAGGGIRKAF